MNIDITFPPPTALVPIAEAYARTIKRPDIPIEFTKNEAYEYAIPDDVPTHHVEVIDPVLASLGALLIDKWVCVAPGIGVVETLRGKEFVPWWYVYTYETRHGGWDAPDEVETLPLCDARAPEEALRLALMEVIGHELDQQARYEAEQKELNYEYEQDVPQ